MFIIHLAIHWDAHHGRGRGLDDQLGFYSQDVFEKNENKGCSVSKPIVYEYPLTNDICEIFGFWTISGHL